MPRGIVEGWIHQHGIGAVRQQACGCKGRRIGLDIEHAHLCIDRVQGGIIACKPRQRFVDLDQHQPDPGDAMGQCKPCRTDTGAKISHTITRTRGCAGRQQ